MNPTDTIAALNRLVALISSSLPLYLVQTRWCHYCDDAAWASAVTNLANDQRYFAERMAALVTASGGCPAAGSFPMRFTDLHYVSVAHLSDLAQQELRQQLACVGQALAALPGGSPAHAVVEELQGNLLGHLSLVAPAGRATR